MHAIKDTLLHYVERYGRIDYNLLITLTALRFPLDDSPPRLDIERAYNELLAEGKLAQVDGGNGHTHVYMGGGHA